MAERQCHANEMFWAFLWWLAALVGGARRCSSCRLLIPDDPAAGLDLRRQ